MIDILNDEKYRKYRDKFVSQKKQKYPATEIGYIHRGLDQEPELLVLCDPRNVEMVKRLIMNEVYASANACREPQAKGAICCAVCNQPIKVYWQKLIHVESLNDALDCANSENSDSLQNDTYPEAACSCIHNEPQRKPSLRQEDYDLIKDTRLYKGWGSALFDDSYIDYIDEVL